MIVVPYEGPHPRNSKILPIPCNVPPGTAESGDVLFDLTLGAAHGYIDESSPGRFEVEDILSRTKVSFSTGVGGHVRQGAEVRTGTDR
jgi:hypothetical protein